ncbi:hypothetical protein [Streptomyces axinellae]|uniref:hypothetical protein n=1 Tax=Streptomyces axinellae TaxID=552788 RepID=UPI0031D483D3
MARTGPFAGAPRTYREDQAPLYDWRPPADPAISFSQGIPAKNGLAPRSLQQHQNRPSDSALVSLTRNPDPKAKPSWAQDPVSGVSHRRTVLGPGGYDFVTSLAAPSKVERGEVGQWKGVKPEFVARIESFDRNNNQLWTKDNPNASDKVKARLMQLDHEATPDRVHQAAARAMRGQATAYDQLRHLYAEAYAEFSEKRGEPAAHGARAQEDGNMRAYAEWWQAHRQDPTIKGYADTWKAKYGRDDSHSNVASAAWASRRTLGPSGRPPHATASGGLRRGPQGVSTAQLFPRERPPVSNANPNANPNANSGNKRRRLK